MVFRPTRNPNPFTQPFALGGNIGFTPAAISGLAGWYDASAITGLSDNAAVTQWDDLSGNGRHLTQGTGTRQPTYKTAIQNGRPIVRFDGTSDSLDRTGMSGIDVTRTLVAVVAQSTTTAGERFAFVARQALGANIIFRLISTTHRPFISNGQITTVTANASWHTHIFWRDSGTLYYRRTGTLVSGSVTYNANVNPTDFRIGAELATGNYWSGDIAEVIVYARASGDFDATTEVGALETYLRSKWGI